METTNRTSGNMRGSERNNGDITEFHESARSRQSETKSGDARDASIEDKSNVHDASTTDASPRHSHARDASTSETIPRRTKRISLQNKSDTCNAHKYVQTDTVIEYHASIEEKSSNKKGNCDNERKNGDIDENGERKND